MMNMVAFTFDKFDTKKYVLFSKFDEARSYHFQSNLLVFFNLSYFISEDFGANTQ